MVLNNSTFNIPNCGDHIPWQRTDTLPYGASYRGSLPFLYGYLRIGIENYSYLAVEQAEGVFTRVKTENVSQRMATTFSTSPIDYIGAYFNSHNYKEAYERDDNLVLPSHIYMYYVIKY